MEKDSKSSEKISGRRGRIENLKPFKKGQSGNPAGHPKGQRNYATIYREALIKLGRENNKTPEDIENEMVANGALLARKGDFRFYKDVLDRLHGTATNVVDIKGNLVVQAITGMQIINDANTIQNKES